VIEGRDRVVRMILGLIRRGAGLGRAQVRRARINGLPGFVAQAPDGDVSTYAFELDRDAIRRVFVVRNPDKLGHVRGR